MFRSVLAVVALAAVALADDQADFAVSSGFRRTIISGSGSGPGFQPQCTISGPPRQDPVGALLVRPGLRPEGTVPEPAIFPEPGIIILFAGSRSLVTICIADPGARQEPRPVPQPEGRPDQGGRRRPARRPAGPS